MQEREVGLGSALKGSAQGVKDTDLSRCAFDNNFNEARIELWFSKHTSCTEFAHLVPEGLDSLDAR